MTSHCMWLCTLIEKVVKFGIHRKLLVQLVVDYLIAILSYQVKCAVTTLMIFFLQVTQRMKSQCWLLIFCVLVQSQSSVSVDIPEHWTKYIVEMIQRTCPPSATIINPPSFQFFLSQSDELEPMDLSATIMPQVLLWNPMEQFPLLQTSSRECPRENCKQTLQLHMWSDGQRKGMQPRLIHDIRNMVLLVSAVYRCSHNHIVYGTDASILRRIHRVHIPFILLYRTGFTRGFVQCIVSLAQEGLSMEAICRHIETARQQYMADKIQQVIVDYNIHTKRELSTSHIQSIAESAVVRLITHPLPTNDIITRCFVINFEENEAFYASQMLQLQIEHCLRLDHTFQVASNIGYQRSDGKWVTQYSSIFIVLNERGQVVAWQLTNSTAFDEISQVLSALRQRIDKSQEMITIYVDNCCQVRGKLQEIFGTSCQVKLDVFHAVQRVTRAMSKKHSFFHACIRDLRLVFRYPVDIGIQRTMPTPEPAHILQNMENFVSKWKDVEANDHEILTDKAMQQIEALKNHIKHGCLSNIEPSGGTNFNEALHRHINPHFSHAGRMGLPLACALLTTLFYRHNCKKDKILNSLIGILRSKLTSVVMPSPPPFGIIAKKSLTCSAGQDMEKSLPQIPDTVGISDGDKDTIVKKALSMLQLGSHIKKLVGCSSFFSYQMLPFMTYVPSLHMCCLQSSQEFEQLVHSQRLSNILAACKLRRYNIEGDGNCFFNTVSYSLLRNFSELTDQHRAFLHQRGLDIGMNMTDMAMKLRQLAVREWIQNSSQYQKFLTSTKVEEEAVKFLSPSKYDGDLGDTMLICMANLLETSIIVFSSMSYHPVFCITPQVETIPVPLTVAYNQYGEGHFDGVIPIEENEDCNESQISCSCGKNDNAGSGKQHCSEVTHKYTTTIKCGCLKSKRGCGPECKCRNCSNSLGKRPEVRFTGKRRKREQHEWQQHKSSSSLDFARFRQEEVRSGPPTKLEYFVLENIVSFCGQKDIEINVDNVTSIYASILTSATRTDPTLHLSKKSIKEVETYLKSRLNTLKTFQELCKMQLRHNLDEVSSSPNSKSRRLN